MTENRLQELPIVLEVAAESCSLHFKGSSATKAEQIFLTPVLGGNMYTLCHRCLKDANHTSLLSMGKARFWDRMLIQRQSDD